MRVISFFNGLIFGYHLHNFVFLVFAGLWLIGMIIVYFVDNAKTSQKAKRGNVKKEGGAGEGLP